MNSDDCQERAVAAAKALAVTVCDSCRRPGEGESRWPRRSELSGRRSPFSAPSASA